jgi:hypothetical protein
MTPDKQIEQLDNRVTRLEERTDSEISSIHAKLDALVTAVNKSIVTSVKSQCPAPGSCLVLAEQIKTQMSYLTATTSRVERLELRMLDGEKWQGKVIGGLCVLMTLLTLFAPMIRQLFRLE